MFAVNGDTGSLKLPKTLGSSGGDVPGVVQVVKLGESQAGTYWIESMATVATGEVFVIVYWRETPVCPFSRNKGGLG
jgi:hypothetical protein